MQERLYWVVVGQVTKCNVILRDLNHVIAVTSSCTVTLKQAWLCSVVARRHELEYGWAMSRFIVSIT